MSDFTHAITPSEVVLLHGREFAPTAMLGTRLLVGDGKVKTRPWMEATWLAATAAVVEAGQLRLSHNTSKRLFGLFTRQGLTAEATEAGNVAWPAFSLEQRILESVARAPADLQLVYQALLEVDSGDPASWGLTIAQRGLLRRGLLVEEENKVLKVLTTRATVVPPSTVTLVAVTSPQPVQRLLQTGAGLEPATWALARQALGAAIALRKETERSTN